MGTFLSDKTYAYLNNIIYKIIKKKRKNEEELAMAFCRNA